MDFILLLTGTDANAYFMARCYHEKYGKKAYLLGRNPIWYTSLSNIVNIKYNPNIWDENEFLNELNLFYNNHSDKKILLVGCAENYITMISKNKDKLKDKFIFSYPDIDLINTLINKELFYKKFENNDIITLPKTIYYNCSKKEKLKIDFTYPIIVKPSDVVSYRKLEFNGKKKIFKIENEDELNKIVNDIKQGGYNNTLIIQEYIPGDDSHLFDSVIYSDKNGKVKRITLAQIGLQEHNANFVGNATVMINGYNQFGNSDRVVNMIKEFAESINYKGFAEFDLKYDSRDNKFKVLEINPRQGRSSYYLNGLGCNLIEILEKDLIQNEELNYQFLNKEVMLSFVSKSIIKKYILNEKYKKKALSLWKNHLNPIKYNKDLNIKRRYMLYKKSKTYNNDYKYGYWKNK